MPNKKTSRTKQSEIPKKVDNEVEPKMKPVAIKWHELEQYVGQPIWDTREKKWRVLDGYRRTGNTYSITFSDIADWCSFLDRELYLEEEKENESNDKSADERKNRGANKRGKKKNSR